MAAPTRVGSAYTMTFSSIDVVELTIISGFAAGNTVGVLVQQPSTVSRTINSLSDGTNSYAEIVKAGSAGVGPFVNLHAKVAISALGSGGTLTLTFSGDQAGRLTAQEITASTYSTLSDTFVRTTSSTSHACGTTGLTTSGDVFVFGVACHNGDHGGVTPGDGYSVLNTVGETVSLYKGSSAVLTSSIAPFVTTNLRSVTGAMAAFYAAGGATAFPAHYYQQMMR